MQRRAACLAMLLAGCGSKATGGTPGDPTMSTPCSEEGVMISGLGEVPALGWMKLAELEPHAVAVDADGNVFVAGELTFGVDLGGGPLLGGGLSGSDAFLVSYTAAGKHRWSKRFGGSGYDRFIGLGVDAEGIVYATGELTPGADLGTGALGENQVFVASFGNGGALRWVTPIDVARAHDLTVRPDGTSFVTGEFGTTANLGGEPLTGAGNVDAFLGSFDATGAHRWSTSFGTATGNEGGYGLATDGSGFALIGRFDGTVTLGGVPVQSGGGTDVVVSSYDEAGAHRWSNPVGAAGADLPGNVAVSASGTTYATGTWSVGGTGSADESDSFLATFDADGMEGTLLRPEGPGFSVGTAVAVDADGGVVAAGRFSGTTDLGGGELQTDDAQAWLVSYDGSLTHRWSLGLDWAGPPSGPDAVATGPDGEVYLIGQFSVPREKSGMTTVERPFLLKFVEDCR